MSKNETIKKEWDEASESWTDFVRHGKDYYRDELNNPAAFKLLGDVKDKAILDLACGEGYNTRILARKGARVTGVDISHKMIELAKETEAREKLGINYHISDAAKLTTFPDGHFDVVTCFMSMQDIENHEKTVSEVARVLRTGGRFVFSIPHPCFEAITTKKRRISASERYFGTVRYPLNWDMPRLLKQFRTSSYHRTLTDYSEALFTNKLLILRLVEPKPTKEGIRKHPPLKQVLVRPQSIIIESTKVHI